MTTSQRRTKTFRIPLQLPFLLVPFPAGPSCSASQSSVICLLLPFLLVPFFPCFLITGLFFFFLSTSSSRLSGFISQNYMPKFLITLVEIVGGDGEQAKHLLSGQPEGLDPLLFSLILGLLLTSLSTKGILPLLVFLLGAHLGLELSSRTSSIVREAISIFSFTCPIYDEQRSPVSEGHHLGNEKSI